MASYELRWKSSAEKDLRKLDPQLLPRIIDATASLAKERFPSQSRKLHGTEHQYRLRIGDYRVIYEVDEVAKVIVVHHVRHRRDAYRR